MKNGSCEFGSITNTVTHPATTMKVAIQKRPTWTSFLSSASGLTYFLYTSKVMMVAAELSMESTEERMAPIKPAATKPSMPKPTGFT